MYRWLRGQDFDVNDEFDKYARLQNEEGESPATLIKNKSFEKSYVINLWFNFY